MRKSKKSINITDIVLVGLFAAVVHGGQYIRFTIPTPTGNTAISLGNIFVLLSGFILGPVRGGLAAGIGSYLFSLTNAGHFNVIPFQFVLRFAQAFVCGLLAKEGLARRYIAAVAGQVTYIVLLFAQWFFWESLVVKGMMPVEALIAIFAAPPIPPFVSWLINGVIAVAVVAPLVPAIRNALSTNKMRH
jgi:uncharacterized membrane protein